MPMATLHRNAENTFDAADRLVSATVAYNGSRRTVQEMFLYDGNGAMTNATSGGETVFSASYDAQGRLASLGGPPNMGGPPSSAAAFSYDALGNRILFSGHIFVPDHSDPLKRPLIECDADGTPLRYYIWGPGRLLGFIDAGRAGSPLPADTLTVVHSDEQGSVIALTDTDGGLLYRASYSPHGEDWGFAGTNATPFAWLGGLGVMRTPPLGSSATTNSQFSIFNSQFYLTRHRLYSPVLRRFLSADPLGIDGGPNLYAYANGDPLAYIDPLGLCASGGDWGTRIGGFFQMIGGSAEAALGYGFAGLTAETVAGAVAGVAVGLHGTDAAIAGYYTMVNGVPQDTLTSQGLQAVGVPQDWANGIDAGLSMSGTMGVGAATESVMILTSQQAGSLRNVGSMARVRHHTSAENLRKIQTSNVINPARGDPIGVHVETQPFGPVSSASRDVGAFGRGAYIEFDQPQTIVPTYIGPRHTGVIPTEVPLSIENLNPVFYK